MSAVPKILSILALLAVSVACSDPVTEAPPAATFAPPTRTPVAAEAPTAPPAREPVASERPTAPATSPPVQPPPTAVPPTTQPTAAPPTPEPTEAVAPEEEKTLTLLYWQAPSHPGPYLSSGYKDRDAGAITLEPLAKYDPDGRLVPALAAEIPSIENGGFSEDLQSITWKLKKDVKWSDGSAVPADDAVFTWRYCTDEHTGCTAHNSFAGVTSVEAVDAHTVRVTFGQPTPYPYGPFVGTGVPIISEEQFRNCVGDAAATCLEENYAPLGTGPYRVSVFTPNEEAVYERNPHFRGDAPYFEKVVIKGGGDALSAAQDVLDAGEADYAWNLQIDPGTLAELEGAGKGTAISAFSSLVERIVLNQTNPDPSLGEDRSEYLDGQNPHPFLTFRPIQGPCRWQ